jgi:hypothetical protein
MTELTKEKVVDAVKETVKQFIEEKELSSKVEMAEKLVGDASRAIDELTTLVEQREAELASQSKELDSLMAKIRELDSLNTKKVEETEALVKEKQEAVLRAEKAELTLSEIEGEQRLAARFAALVEAKVAKTGDKLEAQKSKVKGMSDDEFATYKDELIEIRAELEQSLKAELAEEAVTEEETEEDSVSVAPPQISSEAASVVVVPNSEVEIVSIEAKYRAMGKAWADQVKTKK